MQKPATKDSKLKRKICEYIDTITSNQLANSKKICEPIEAKIIGFQQISDDDSYYLQVNFSKKLLGELEKVCPELAKKNLIGKMIQLIDWHFEHTITKDEKLDLNLIINKIKILGKSDDSNVNSSNGERQNMLFEPIIHQKLFQLERFLYVQEWEGKHENENPFEIFEQVRYRKSQELKEGKVVQPSSNKRLSQMPLAEIFDITNNSSKYEENSKLSDLSFSTNSKKPNVKEINEVKVMENKSFLNTNPKNISNNPKKGVDIMLCEEETEQSLNDKKENYQLNPNKRNYSKFISSNKDLEINRESENNIEPFNKKLKSGTKESIILTSNQIQTHSQQKFSTRKSDNQYLSIPSTNGNTDQTKSGKKSVQDIQNLHATSSKMENLKTLACLFPKGSAPEKKTPTSIFDLSLERLGKSPLAKENVSQSKNVDLNAFPSLKDLKCKKVSLDSNKAKPELEGSYKKAFLEQIPSSSEGFISASLLIDKKAIKEDKVLTNNICGKASMNSLKNMFWARP